MAERFVKSHIAECVAEFLGARERRTYLKGYGWSQGMPIIMARANEPLEDVMGLVATHPGPALIASIDPVNLLLRFLHVSTPTGALKDVDVCPDSTEVWTLFAHAEHGGIATFRTKYTPHSSVAHLLPLHGSQQPAIMPTPSDMAASDSAGSG